MSNNYEKNMDYLAGFIQKTFEGKFGAEFTETLLRYRYQTDLITNLAPFLLINDAPELVWQQFEESKQMREKMIKEILLRARGRILDAGCNKGTMTAAIGADLGIDINLDILPFQRWFSLISTAFKEPWKRYG